MPLGDHRFLISHGSIEIHDESPLGQRWKVGIAWTLAPSDRFQGCFGDFYERTSCYEGPRFPTFFATGPGDIAGLGNDSHAYDFRFNQVYVFACASPGFRRQGECWVKPVDEPLLAQDTVSLAPIFESRVDIGGGLEDNLTLWLQACPVHGFAGPLAGGAT